MNSNNTSTNDITSQEVEIPFAKKPETPIVDLCNRRPPKTSLFKNERKTVLSKSIEANSKSSIEDSRERSPKVYNLEILPAAETDFERPQTVANQPQTF